MKKIWIYISTFLLGLAAGIVVGVKIMGEQVSVTVRKVKNKRTSGDNSVTIPIQVEKAKKRPKKSRKQKRFDRLKEKL
jgi:hypothetical protein